MEPAFRNGDIVLVSSFPYLFRKPKIGETIVLKKEKFIIKRIVKINADNFFVVGDNKEKSIDSRNFGWVNKKEIVGKVILKI